MHTDDHKSPIPIFLTSVLYLRLDISTVVAIERQELDHHHLALYLLGLKTKWHTVNLGLVHNV